MQSLNQEQNWLEKFRSKFTNGNSMQNKQQKSIQLNPLLVTVSWINWIFYLCRSGIGKQQRENGYECKHHRRSEIQMQFRRLDRIQFGAGRSVRTIQQMARRSNHQRQHQIVGSTRWGCTEFCQFAVEAYVKRKFCRCSTNRWMYHKYM